MPLPRRLERPYPHPSGSVLAHRGYVELGAHARIRTGDLFLTNWSSVPGEFEAILGNRRISVETIYLVDSSSEGVSRLKDGPLARWCGANSRVAGRVESGRLPARRICRCLGAGHGTKQHQAWFRVCAGDGRHRPRGGSAPARGTKDHKIDLSSARLALVHDLSHQR